jgi:2',3'-cyclic-nucleotide 2'-phosphodiesterase (5'-nucleotidase family)
MNAVVCYSDTPMPKLKNVTESLLGNFVANLTFEVANEKADFCLLNFGGLRTSIPKGPITRGKLFELMPFENSLIIVEISDEKFRELIKYLINVNGQPVSNLTLSVSKSDTICKIGKDEYIPNGQNIKVLTTDYLANGGDHMNFFIDPILKQNLGIKLRDAIISHCSSKNTKGEFIGSTIENKFKFQ